MLVLDPSNQKWDGVDFLTSDTDKFVDVVFRNTRCLVIVDETMEAIDRNNKSHLTLATRSRHKGHSVFFLAQRAAQIPPTIRTQCEQAYVFKQAIDDITVIKKMLTCGEDADLALKLPRGKCVYLHNFKESREITVF